MGRTIYGFCENKGRHKLDAVKVSSTQPTTEETVWIQKRKNLFNTSGLMTKTDFGITTTFGNSKMIINGTSTGSGAYYNKQATQIKLPAGRYTWSLVKKSGTITKNGGDIAIYLGTEKNTTGLGVATGTQILSQHINITNFTLEEETVLYLHMWVNGTNVEISNLELALQIEQGATATEYEEYIEPKIYVKTDNGEYEEIYSKEALYGRVLYENEAGSNSDITLNENAEGYDYLEIFYARKEADGSKQEESSTKVYNPNGKAVSLLNGFLKPNGAEGGGLLFQIESRIVVINGTSITASSDGYVNINKDGIQNIESVVDKSSSIYITRVVGY